MAEPGREAPLYFRNRDGKYPWSLLTWPGHYFIVRGSNAGVGHACLAMVGRNYKYRGILEYKFGDFPEGRAVILVNRCGVTGPIRYERKATVDV